MRIDAPPKDTDAHTDHIDLTGEHHHLYHHLDNHHHNDNHHISLHGEALSPSLSEARLVGAEVFWNFHKDSVCLSRHRCHRVDVPEPVEGNLARSVDRVEQGGAGVQLPPGPSLHHLENWDVLRPPQDLSFGNTFKVFP